MEKNYLNIVLDGWVNSNSRAHLINYFKRQMKVAESEFYDNEEFTNGCLGIIKAFENNLNSQIQKEKYGFYMALDYYKSLHSKKIEVNGKMVDRLSKIESTKDYISSLSTDNFNVYLPSFTNNVFSKGLNSNEVEFIKNTIILACLTVKDNAETSKPANEKQSKPIDKSESQKLNAPIIAKFCELCNNSKLDGIGFDEDKIPYCKRICNKFNLPYTGNIRKVFRREEDIKSTDKNLKKVIELILPTISKADREVIDNYIKSKINLYS